WLLTAMATPFANVAPTRVTRVPSTHSVAPWPRPGRRSPSVPAPSTALRDATARSVAEHAMATVSAWFTSAFVLSTTAGGRSSRRSPATNAPSVTASGVPVNVLERAFSLQRGHGLRAQTEPIAQHLLRVLSQHGRRLDARGRAIDTHRPARHLEGPMHGVNHGLHDPALLERDVLVQLVGVEHRARGTSPSSFMATSLLFLRVQAEMISSTSGSRSTRSPGVR